MLCRVVNKPPHKNSPSEIGRSCCAEESAAVAVRHIGVQHDGCVGGDVDEVQVRGDGSVNREIEAAENPIRCGGEPDHDAPVSVAQGSQPVRNLTLI